MTGNKATKKIKILKNCDTNFPGIIKEANHLAGGL